MVKIFSNTRGFSLTEVLFAFAISVMVMGVAISGWVFTHNTWSGEKYNTLMRIDLLEASELLKSDIRLSSGTHMAFYPDNSAYYTAVMMPRADADATGTLSIGSDGIEWTRTVFYYMLEEEGTSKLYRAELSSWNSALDPGGRYDLLENIVTGVTQPSSVRVLIGEELAQFKISRSGQVIDFYADSVEPERDANVLAGYFSFSSGSYTITFLVTGKNPDSAGYGFGIDSIRIDPSGSYREVEYYDSSFAPLGMLSSSGRTTTSVHGTEWSNNNFLEYPATIEGDYISFTDYYDLWRDSAFRNSSPDNVTLYGDEVRAKLEVPEDREDMDKEDIVWDAFDQADATNELGSDISIVEEDQPLYPVAIRTIVTGDKINTMGLTEADRVRGSLIRVKFTASSQSSLKIGAAYITRRDGEVGMAGLENSTLGDIEDRHLHQRLFFESDSGVSVLAGGEVWSDWVAFPLVVEDNIHYFISFSVTEDPGTYRGWEGGGTVSYYYAADIGPDMACTVDSSGNTFTVTSSMAGISEIVIKGSPVPGGSNEFSIRGADDMAGTPDWESEDAEIPSSQVYYVIDLSGNTFRISETSGGLPVDLSSNGSDVRVAQVRSRSLYNTSSDMFATAEIDAWKKKGSITSKIYDTALSSPSYNQIKWSEEKPSGTDIKLKARSSNDPEMFGATDWADISGSGTNPHSISVGTGRYVQYRAEMETEPYWKWGGGTLGYSSYVTEQAGYSDSHAFPVRSGEYLAADVNAPWVDDVEIDWPGGSRICAIMLDIARQNDFGQVEIDVDGQPLVRTLDITIELSKDFGGRKLRQSASFEVESRNTGK